MKIVFLDAKSIGEDIDLSAYDALGEVIKYDFSTAEEAAVRSVDADVLVLNKVEVNEKTIGNASHLKLVCVTATGTNNLDKAYLEKRGIAWRNVAGYSTESVAQHTFAMLFYLLEKLPYYDRYVKDEKYIGDKMFTHFDKHFGELAKMTWGISDLEISEEELQILQKPLAVVSFTIPLPDETASRAMSVSASKNC